VGPITSRTRAPKNVQLSNTTEKIKAWRKGKIWSIFFKCLCISCTRMSAGSEFHARLGRRSWRHAPPAQHILLAAIFRVNLHYIYLVAVLISWQRVSVRHLRKSAMYTSLVQPSMTEPSRLPVRVCGTVCSSLSLLLHHFPFSTIARRPISSDVDLRNVHHLRSGRQVTLSDTFVVHFTYLLLTIGFTCIKCWVYCFVLATWNGATREGGGLATRLLVD